MEDTKERTYEQLALEIQVQTMDTNTYVFKSHNLIESGYNFTLNEQRLTYLATKKLKPRYIKSKIKPSEIKTLFGHEEFKDLRIYVNEFKEEFNLSSNNLYRVLEDTAKSLKKKELNYLQDDGTFVEKSWVITSKYNPEGKYVDLTFHPDLILDLLVIKGKFGKMEYNSTKTFNTSYAFRVYELLQNYAYRGNRRFELEDFRYKLGIYDDAKYTKYSEFKRNVLTPSLESINNNTNLNISLKEIRYGRKVGAIEFIISQITTQLNDIEDDIDVIDASQVANMEGILGCKLTAGQVAELTDLAISAIRENKINMSFYDYIKYEVNRVHDYAKTTTIKNYYGTVKTAIEEYWIENISLPKSNMFNNFDGRPEAKDEKHMKGVEEKLLGWDKSEEKEEIAIDVESSSTVSDLLKEMQNKA
jgi:plasmid replication initiation protein